MDWIERWFGVAPDNGDGSLELLIMLVVAAVIVVAVVWRVPPARAWVLRYFTQMREKVIGRDDS